MTVVKVVKPQEKGRLSPLATPCCKQFTLIELLVVIAIISVLASFLLPAFTQVRAKARTVVCMNQMRQVYLLFAGYQADSGGYFPPTGMAEAFGHNAPGVTIESSGGKRWKWSWREFLFYDSYGITFNCHYPINSRDSVLTTYPLRVGIFRCPSLHVRPFYPPPSEPGRLLGQSYKTNMRQALGMRSGASQSIYMPWVCNRARKWRSEGKPVSGGWKTYADPSCILMYDAVYEIWGDVPLRGGGVMWVPSNRYKALWRPWYTTIPTPWLRHRWGANYLYGDGRVIWSDDYHKIRGDTYPWSIYEWREYIP